MTVLEVTAWLAYLVPVMFLYFRAAKPVVVPATTDAERAAAAATVAGAADVTEPALAERTPDTTARSNSRSRARGARPPPSRPSL